MNLVIIVHIPHRMVKQTERGFNPTRINDLELSLISSEIEEAEMNLIEIGQEGEGRVKT